MTNFKISVKVVRHIYNVEGDDEMLIQILLEVIIILAFFSIFWICIGRPVVNYISGKLKKKKSE